MSYLKTQRITYSFFFRFMRTLDLISGPKRRTWIECVLEYGAQENIFFVTERQREWEGNSGMLFVSLYFIYRLFSVTHIINNR
jgi:hypothetical protein